MEEKDTIQQDFTNADILSLSQFSKDSLLSFFATVSQMKEIAQKKEPSTILSGNIITLLFYEPSSRTFASFSAAVKRLGGQTIEFPNPDKTSSSVKGETLEDTVRVLEAYSDAIVIRHPEKGATQKAAQSVTIPVINAGDGIGEHPTQALLDLYTIYEKKERLDNLTILIAGDLLNGRTVHSLLRGLSYFKNNTVYLLSPPELRLERADFHFYEQNGLRLFEIGNAEDIPKNADVWYWTRVQKERFKDQNEYEKLKSSFIVTPSLLDTHAKDDTILMHPLPRVGEITTDVDDDPRALYLRDEVQNGLSVRMALMALVLGKLTL